MQVPLAGHDGTRLLERDDTLDELAAQLESARRGRGRAVLIGAEAGAGKTSVVREFTRGVDDRTGVLEGACDPLSTPRPLGPFLDLGTRARRLLEVGQVGSSSASVFACLREMLTEQTTVVVLEDLHWADEATLDVVRLIVRRIETLPTLLIGTHRDDELGQDHPVRTMLGDLATAGGVTRLGLRPLSLAAVTELAGASGIDPTTLHERTGGNPFFVSEVLAGGDDHVPMTVRDAILARTGALPPDARALLDVIALSSPAADARVLARFPGEHDDALDRCLTSGLLTAEGHEIRFRHELARLAVEQELSPTRRIALHRQLLDALGGHDERAVDPARLAHHAEGADDAQAVLEHAPIAARQAARAGAYREAAAQYRRTLRFASALGDGDRADLLEGLSRACYLADDQVAAIEEVRHAIECRRRAGETAPLARALVELAGYLQCRGHLTESRQAVDQAVDLVDGSPATAAHAHVDDFVARTRSDELPLDTCLDLARRAREIGERVGDPLVAGHATVTEGSLTMTFDPERGARMLEGAVRRADELGHHEIGARALNNLAARRALSGNRVGANDDAARAIAYCTEHMEDLWRINALAIAARNTLELDRWDEAVDHANAVLRDPRDSPWPHHEALLVLALVRARRGDPGATPAADAAAAVGVPDDEITAHVDLAAARAEIAWTERRIDELDRITSDAIDAARARGDGATVARLGFWRRLGGLDDQPTPFAVPDRAFPPYETTLAELLGDDEASLRAAHDVLLHQGALPASRIAARRLRELGVHDIEVGPRSATRRHPAGLTPREHEVVKLLAEGLRNVEIADRLVISRRTVDHHVAAIMRKLDARSRGEAVARLAEIELTSA